MPEIKPFSISRILNAPKALVYKVNTEPEHLAKWLSPAGFANIYVKHYFKVGGTYHYGLKGPDGNEMWGKQVYKEIVPNEKLVVIQSFSNKEGGVTRHPMSATWPLEMLATTVFEDLGNNKTKVTITWAPFNADEVAIATFDGARPSMNGGFEGTFLQLEAYLASLQS